MPWISSHRLYWRHHQPDTDKAKEIVSNISKEEEEQASQSFDKIVFDNFAEDRSEDWWTHGSEATPDKELGHEIFGEPDQEFKGLYMGY